MKILLVMSDTWLWKPEYVESVAAGSEPDHAVVAAVLTRFQPARVSRWKHLRRHLTLFGFRLSVQMGLLSMWHKALDLVDRVVRLGRAHSIAGVCRRRGIPVLKTSNPLAPESLAWMRRFEPDILLSSGHTIFGPELLGAAGLVCLNRHTSLLPAYQGIYPIFWCLLNGEDHVGVSVHTMTENLDEGIVLSQKSVPVKPDDTFWSLYAACFRLSVDATLEAIEKAARGDFSAVDCGLEPSYYGYPTREDVQRFRAKGKRMI